MNHQTVHFTGIGLNCNPSPPDEPEDFTGEMADAYIAELTFGEACELCRLYRSHKAKGLTERTWKDWLQQHAIEQVSA